jgi:hypothetical protein
VSATSGLPRRVVPFNRSKARFVAKLRWQVSRISMFRNSPLATPDYCATSSQITLNFLLIKNSEGCPQTLGFHAVTRN